MKNEEKKISIFDYRDYRTYLKDWYETAKKIHPLFSYRAFAKKAEFKSSNFLMLVINGKRNLTKKSLEKTANALNLNKQEREFFENLVFFNQAKTHSEKNNFYKRLLKCKKYSQLKPIEKKQYEYYSAWYHPAVRELVISKNFDGTPEWISKRLSPAVSPAQVKKSIELLAGLGFIEETSPDKWKQSSTLISTGPTLKSVVVHNYHKTLLDLTKDVIDTIPVENRDVTTMTLGIKKERVEEIIGKIRDFRHEILELVALDKEPEDVLQLNIQFFPLTRTSNNTKKGGGNK